MKSVTYKKVSMGLKPLRRLLELKTKEYRKYQARLTKFVFWWNDHCVSSYNGSIVGSVLKLRRKNYICINSRINHEKFIIEIDVKSTINAFGLAGLTYRTIRF